MPILHCQHGRDKTVLSCLACVSGVKLALQLLNGIGSYNLEGSDESLKQLSSIWSTLNNCDYKAKSSQLAKRYCNLSLVTAFVLHTGEFCPSWDSFLSKWTYYDITVSNAVSESLVFLKYNSNT